MLSVRTSQITALAVNVHRDVFAQFSDVILTTIWSHAMRHEPGHQFLFARNVDKLILLVGYCYCCSLTRLGVRGGQRAISKRQNYAVRVTVNDVQIQPIRHDGQIKETETGVVMQKRSVIGGDQGFHFKEDESLVWKSISR
jgi:hypothetical protein